MADRSITLRLSANVSGLQAGLRTAARATRDFDRDLSAFASRNEEHLSRVGTAGMAVGAGLIVGVGMAVKAAADFDKAMSSVESATHETAANMDLLREAAISAGADTAFSAEEAAKGIEELAKAGVSTKDVLAGGLSGALSLAAAGSLGVGEAAEIAASAMTVFGGEMEDKGKLAVHVADLLAAGAGKAQGSVQDLGAALNQSGLVAASTGLTIEETTGALASFAAAGMTGSDAGTSFKTMLMSLNPNSKEAAGLMEDLGIKAYDANGSFIGMSEYAGVLQGALKDMGDEQRNATMKTLFGSDAVRAANILYEEGAEGIQEWEDAVNSAGYAASTAMIMQDNLAGDLEKLGGSFDSLLIKSGSGVAESLRGLVQGAEDVVDAFGKIPAPVLNAGLGMAGMAGGALLVGGAVMTALPKVVEFRESLRTLAPAGSSARGALLGVGKAAGIAAAAIIALQMTGTLFTEKKVKSVEDYGQALLKLGNAAGAVDGSGLDSIFGDFDKQFGVATTNVNNLKDAVRQLVNPEDHQQIVKAWEPLTNFLQQPKSDLSQFEDRLNGLGDAMGSLVKNGASETAAKSFQALTQEFKLNGQGAEEALKYLPGYRDALLEQANAAKVVLEPHELLDLAMGKIPASMQAAMGATETYTDAAGKAAPVTEEMAGALEEVGLSAAGAVTDIGKFADALFSAGLLSLSASDAAINYQDAIDKMTESVTKNGRTLDINTEAGRANQSAFNSLAQAAMATAEATATETLATEGSAAAQSTLQTSLGESYKQLLTTAEGFVGVGAEAEAMARKALGIPDNVTIEAWVAGHAGATLDGIKGKADALDGKRVSIFATTYERIVKEQGQSAGNQFVDSSGMGSLKRATGGPIFGPGTGTSDDIPAWLSNGEHVWTAEEVRRAGGHAAVESLRARALKGIPAFATGGRVAWSQGRDEYFAKVAADATARREALASARWHAQQAYDKIGASDKNKARKDAANRVLKDAENRLASAEKVEDRAKEKLRDAKERTARLSESTRDLRTDARRGDIVGSVMSGSGLSIVDRLRGESRNMDLTKRQRGNLSRVADSSEEQLLAMEKQSESLAAKLEVAKDKYDELVSIQSGIASGLKSEQSFSGFMGLADDKAAAKSQANLDKVTARYAAKLEKVTAKLEAARAVQAELYATREGVASGLQGGFTLSGALGLMDEKAAAKAQSTMNKVTAKYTANLDKVTAKLEAARAIQADLYAVRDGIASGISGGFSLSGVLGIVDEQAGVVLGQRTVKAQAGLDEIAKKLEAAQGRLDDLRATRAGIGAGLASEQSLGSALGQTNSYGYDVPVSGRSLVARAGAKLNALRTFAKKLEKLRRLGLSSVILEEVAGLGSEEGAAVADALIKGGKADVRSLNGTYAGIAHWGQKAGTAVAKSMYSGGVVAAKNLAAGLESQQAKVQSTLAGLAAPNAKGKLTSYGMAMNARGMAVRVKKFAWKLDQLRKRGVAVAILEEIAGMGTDEGMQAADALLSGSDWSIKELNTQYGRIAKYSQDAGLTVAKSMYKGGVSAANSLVAGLESQQTKVQSTLAGLAAPDATGKITARGLISNASGMAGRIKSFTAKLIKLRKQGLSGVILEEIAGMGVEEGSRVADALLSGSGSDVKKLNAAYGEISRWSYKAGSVVARSMYKGGISAADSLVAGLESRQSKVQSTLESLTAPDTTGKVTAFGMAMGAKGVADKVRKFATKLSKLRKRGVAGVILEEIAAMGTEEGMRAADALLAGSDWSLRELNVQYGRIEKYSQKVGLNVTKGFYDGGVNAAKGLVAGLADQQGAIEAQLLKIATGMQTALKKALGINSPSKVMQGLMHHVGDGAVLGLKDKRPELEAAMSAMVSAPQASFGSWSGMVPSGSAMSAPVMELSAADRALMSQFITASQAMPPMNLLVNGRQAGAIVQEGSKAVRTLK